MNIYVGNISHDSKDRDLEAAFKQFGAVTSARIITDRATGLSRGFGFVEMASESEANAAIQGLNGKELGGRTITVNESKPRTSETGTNRGGPGRPRF